MWKLLNGKFVFVESSELAEGQQAEEPTETEETEETTENEETPVEPEPEEPKPVKKKVTRKRKPKVQAEPEEKEPEPTPQPNTNNSKDLALENRILKSSIDTGFDPEALTALVMQNLEVSEDGTDNLDTLVQQYVEKYPQLLKETKTKLNPTTPIAPSQVTPQQKDEQRRQRYFGNGSNSFFRGSGVRNNA